MPGGPGNFNRLVWSPGQAIKWPGQGGAILLSPTAQIAGQMCRTDMENVTWHLLREPGPDTGEPAPQTGDFNQSVVDRDLNIWLGTFIGETGLAPMISDKQVTVPVFPVLDFPVPPDLQSLSLVEYTPAGQSTYTLIPTPSSEFSAYYTSTTLSMGQPRRYRELFAGYIRLYPQPGPGQAYGPGIGTVTFTGTPAAGQMILTVITNNPNTPVIIPTYTVLSTDTLTSIPQEIANLIAASNACVGPTAFLQAPEASANSYQLTAINPPGTNISYQTTIIQTGLGLTVSPSGSVFLQPNGDTMTFYYSSTGSAMLLPQDCPGIPVQFHKAIVYGLLSDYWLRKQDPEGNAAKYLKRYKDLVYQAKCYEQNVKRDVQGTLAGYDASDGDYFNGGIN